MEQFRINKKCNDLNPENPDIQNNSWMFNMRNEENFKYTDKYNYNKANSFEELRQRLANYDDKEKYDGMLRNRFSHKQFESQNSKLQLQEPFSEDITAPKRKMCIQTIEQLRKWSCRYNGGVDPYPFLKRVEQLAEAYDINLNSIPRNIAVLLKDEALYWFQNNINIRTWNHWNDFKSDFIRFFSPIRSLDTLEDEIRIRREEHNETFKDYVTGLQNLMPHRVNNTSERFDNRQLAENCQMDYERRNFTNTVELTERRSTLKNKKQKLPQNPNQIVESKIKNPNEACRRCGKQGHFITKCPNPRILYCWGCGKLNIRTIECCNSQLRNDESGQSNSMNMCDQTRESSNTLGYLKINGSRLTANIVIGGQMVEATVDTGATRSFISEQLSEKIGPTIYNEPPEAQCLNREICGRIQFAQNTVFLNLLILPNLVDDIILGIDFLKAMGTTLTIGEFSLDMNNKRQHPDDFSQGLQNNNNNTQIFKKPKFNQYNNSTNSSGMINTMNNCPFPPNMNNFMQQQINNQNNMKPTFYNNPSAYKNNMANNIPNKYNLPQFLNTNQMQALFRIPNNGCNSINTSNVTSLRNKGLLLSKNNKPKENTTKNVPSANHVQTPSVIPKRKMLKKEWPQVLKEEIEDHAKTKFDHKKKGFRRIIDGKMYQVRINRAGSVTVWEVLRPLDSAKKDMKEEKDDDKEEENELNKNEEVNDENKKEEEEEKREEEEENNKDEEEKNENEEEENEEGRERTENYEDEEE